MVNKSRKIGSLLLVGFLSVSLFSTTIFSSSAKTVSTSVAVKQVGSTTDSVNMRKGYSTKHKVLTKLKKNAKVDVLKKMSNNWYQIKYKGKTGYVSGKYLKLTSTNTNTNTVTTVKTYKNQAGTTTTSSLNMRKGYSTKQSIVAKLKKNTKVDVLKKMSNNWYQIKYNGKTGHVSGSYLKVTTKPDDNTNIPTGISMEEFNKWLLLNGFNSNGYYYDANGNSSARVRVVDNEACYAISSVSGNFKKAIKESLNLLLPTKGNELYNTIVNNSFKEQRIKMDGRSVYLCPVIDGIILEIK